MNCSQPLSDMTREPASPDGSHVVLLTYISNSLIVIVANGRVRFTIAGNDSGLAPFRVHVVTVARYQELGMAVKHPIDAFEPQ